MQNILKQFEYIENYRHSLGGDDFALLPCSSYSDQYDIDDSSENDWSTFITA